MRFATQPRSTYTITDRKRAAARRWQKRQRDALPLFAEMIAEQQTSIGRIMTERVERWDASTRSTRERRAMLWRTGRQKIEAYPDEIRRALLTYWNTDRWLPGDPSYLLDMLHRFDTGRLILADGVIRPARVVISLAEATAMEGSRKPMSGGWLGRHP